MTKFQYISDIHLEFKSGFRIKNITAPYLILAGDIGNPRTKEYDSFLHDVSTKFEKVYLVLGNHEFYGSSIKETVKQVQTICEKYNNIIFLQKDIYDTISDIKIIGCTLWSNIPSWAKYDIEKYMNDYRFIHDIHSVEDTNKLHEIDLCWIVEELEKAKHDNKKCLIITHYAPLDKGTSNPIYEGNTRPMNKAFSTNLSYIFDLYREQIIYWVHGHTHFSHQHKIFPVVSNQKRYPREYIINGFIQEKCINI